MEAAEPSLNIIFGRTRFIRASRLDTIINTGNKGVLWLFLEFERKDKSLYLVLCSLSLGF